MNETHPSLGDELVRLRRARRIRSQDELATLSGVARNTIQKLETGAPAAASPSTLILLARGLAKDLETGAVDQDQAEAYYARLARVAAGLPPEMPAADPAGEITREEMTAALRRLLGRRDVAFALSDVLWSYDRFDDRQRSLLEAAAHHDPL
jgi:transcriptional regulator with XRE-family HTH domain